MLKFFAESATENEESGTVFGNPKQLEYISIVNWVVADPAIVNKIRKV